MAFRGTSCDRVLALPRLLWCRHRLCCPRAHVCCRLISCALLCVLLSPFFLLPPPYGEQEGVLVLSSSAASNSSGNRVAYVDAHFLPRACPNNVLGFMGDSVPLGPAHTVWPESLKSQPMDHNPVYRGVVAAMRCCDCLAPFVLPSCELLPPSVPRIHAISIPYPLRFT